MSLDDIKAALPDYAKDLRLNLASVLSQPGFTGRQIWGTALATAIAARQPSLVQAIAAAAATHLTPAESEAAKSAAAIMAMNNVYYRYLHLSPTQELRNLPARLRMNGLASHGTDPLDFELWCLAVSAVNGCGMCIEAHERTLFEKGASKELVQGAIRIAAVMQAVATTLDGAAALADSPVAAAA
jgi:alkyl hydroperoxide reductase subunit D